MPIPAATIAAFHPWGNAQLTFKVSGGLAGTDAATGDPVTLDQTVEYLASITLSQPDWQKGDGADQTLYGCDGRLLDPQAFDERITNGSQAQAVINGYQGRLELTFDLSMERHAAPIIGQSFKGKFRVTGRG